MKNYIEYHCRCLKDLEVPHFHHELVYEAVVMVIESSHEKTEEAMCKLLGSLFRSFIITIEQMRSVMKICLLLLLIIFFLQGWVPTLLRPDG